MSRLRDLARTLSPTGWTVSAIAVLAVALVVAWIVTLPARKAQEATEARAGQITAQGQAAAGRDAVEVITAAQSRDAAIDAQTQEGNHAIRTAPGAAAPVGADLDAAGRRAVCMRQSARDLASCKRLLDAHP